MWHMYEDGRFWGMHLIWWGIWIILIVWIFFTPWAPSTKPKDSALDLLRERYAQGEINKEEFEERKNILKEK